MVLEISSAALDAIVADANASPAREVCGLLLGTRVRIEAVLPCRNVAENPADSFEIDPQALIAAHRAARDGGPGIVGCYHSHPNGSATPSARDAAAAENGAIWIIAAGGEIGVWRAVSAAFEPVAYERRR
ncbi:M67 family metallopeptidase [Sphingomonas immobilis]|uniref:M67 family metallopeptidase n=1 Tax=Sphingomonas immobilis TaxID=3063997 RepID=A0ABT8ZZ47_9SPHN|nr:M67 family metallopeptidase [Sphingomonas sp. CA1-15]MDO7842849.1 M67 family metallopeptidase [Sphingomonas sp. CA1-15]